MKTFSVLVISCGLLTSPARAEPSLLVSKLMNTPVTMFELGVMKVNNYLASNENTNGYGLKYLWDVDKFEISKFTSKPDSCDEVLRCINKVSSELLENTKYFCWTSKDSNKKCDLYNIMSNFGRIQFATANFYKGKDSSEAVDELKNKTLLSLTRFFNHEAQTLRVECQKGLIDSDAKCSHEIF